MSSQAGCGDSHKFMVFRLDSFGIMGLHVEAEGIGSVIVPIAGIYPKCYERTLGFCR